MTNKSSLEVFLKLPVQIQPIVSEFLLKHPGYEIIYITHMGSVLYGTNSEKSDTDVKVLFIPTQEDLLLKKDTDHYSYSSGNNVSKNTLEDVDVEFYSVHKYLGLLQKGEAGAIDLLFSMFRRDTIIYDLKSFEIIRHKDKLISKKLNSFTGYCLSQTKKYGVKGERLVELTKFISCLKSFKQPETISMNMSSILEFIASHNLVYVGFVEDYAGDKQELVTYLEVLGRKFLLTNQISYVIERLSQIENQYGERSKKVITDNNINYEIILELKELQSILFPHTNL